MTYILTFLAVSIGTFLSFLLVRYLHGRLVKDVYWKYILWDSGIGGVYFGIWPIILEINNSNDLYGIFFVLGIIVVPYIYSIIKKHFVMDHPKIANWLYQLYEFLIYVIWFILVYGTLSSLSLLIK